MLIEWLLDQAADGDIRFNRAEISRISLFGLQHLTFLQILTSLVVWHSTENPSHTVGWKAEDSIVHCTHTRTTNWRGGSAMAETVNHFRKGSLFYWSRRRNWHVFFKAMLEWEIVNYCTAFEPWRELNRLHGYFLNRFNLKKRMKCLFWGPWNLAIHSTLWNCSFDGSIAWNIKSALKATD